MAWLELHQELQDHPKLLHLSNLVGSDDPDHTRAKLENLWLWALDYCLHGRLTVSSRPLDAKDIARASRFHGEPTLWLRSLIESGWIDEIQGGIGGKTLQLHDWQNYAGKLLAQREADRIRKQGERSRKTSGGQRTDGGRTLPYRTLPYLRGEEAPTTPPPAAPAATPSKGPDWDKVTPPETAKTPAPESAQNQPEETPGKALDEAHQLNLTVMSFQEFGTPGTKAKRKALAELRKLGLSHERLRQAAKDNPMGDFYDVYRGLKKTVAEVPYLPRPPLARPPVQQKPRDKAQQEIDLLRIELDTKLSELPPQEVAALRREAEKEAVEKSIFPAARADWVESRLRTRVAEKFGIKGC